MVFRKIAQSISNLEIGYENMMYNTYKEMGMPITPSTVKTSVAMLEGEALGAGIGGVIGGLSAGTSKDKDGEKKNVMAGAFIGSTIGSFGGAVGSMALMRSGLLNNSTGLYSAMFNGADSVAEKAATKIKNWRTKQQSFNDEKMNQATDEMFNDFKLFRSGN